MMWSLTRSLAFTTALPVVRPWHNIIHRTTQSRGIPTVRPIQTRTVTIAETAPPDSSTSPAPPSPIAIIGAGGNMATSLISGLLSHPKPPTIHAAGPTPTLSHLPLPNSNKYASNTEAIRNANMILLCVKPNLITPVLTELVPALDRTAPILSIAAGVTTKAMEEVIDQCGTHAPVLRAMPNLPAAHGEGVTTLTAGSFATEEHVTMAAATLAAVGDVITLPESLFASATSVASCGVAYLFMMCEAMADAGVRNGLPRETALRLAAGTVKGAGVELVEALKDGVHPAVLRNRVESPGGVTIRATEALERMGFRAAVIDAVTTAYERAQEMGDE